MESVKHYELGIFIGVLYVFVYAVGFLNLIATFIFETNSDELTDSRDVHYITYYKIFLLMYSLVMIIMSINLIRGIIKKSIYLINSWLVMCFCVIIYHTLWLLNQVLFFMAYGYVIYTVWVLLGIGILLVLQIVFFKKILKFCLDLYRKKISHQQQTVAIQNSTLKFQNYLRNLKQNDSSILMPITEEELKKQYSNCSSENLQKFEI
ncbi:uncharacterized protein LOC111688999 [Lucilia cuprina]|uniref:uncharacterized protein LOC111688999 n=1 Tax=Lucilia cuprina TaxID=7375 RepID=UPI001F06C3DE|nr:uncharacterized protein LOC111688999 [Lucilia cuprina]